MKFQKYFKSTALINNPLCGIGTYKDVLPLATGQITRAVKKLVLNGSEDWYEGESNYYIFLNVPNREISIPNTTALCTHTENGVITNNTGAALFFKKSVFIHSSLADFKSYIAAQYANGTAVTVWYVLATPETEQITVPSGLSGTVEGYLTQSGTPTPTDPIYPVANNAVGWYPIKNYVRATTWTDGSTYSRSGGSWSSLTKKRSRKKK